MCHDETEVCCGSCSPYEAVVASQLAGPAKLMAYGLHHAAYWQRQAVHLYAARCGTGPVRLKRVTDPRAIAGGLISCA